MSEFCLPLRVYIEDTDAGGIVYYVNYLKYMERARTEFMRSLGFDKAGIFNNELMFVVRDVAIRYRQAARLDDELVATARVTRVGAASLVMQQSVRRAGAALATAEVKVACVGRDSMQPQRLSERMRAALEPA